jgi:hypothetical protein
MADINHSPTSGQIHIKPHKVSTTTKPQGIPKSRKKQLEETSKHHHRTWM